MDAELMRRRSQLFRRIRDFFDSLDYLEADTPLLSPDLIPESCLEVFETRRILPAGTEGESLWLIPSPEIWMKKLIARDRRNIYQICRCFRNGESTGFLHNPEFTMLEYYTMNAGYLDSIILTEELFTALAGVFQEDLPGSLKPPFLRLSMGEAFDRWAGFDLFSAAECGGLEEEARRLGLDPPQGLNTAALYDLIFIHAVEPRLPRAKALALTDYPAFASCLARKSRDGKTVERWELYARGVELANCYSEETEPEEVYAYFEMEEKTKEDAALVPHKVDRDYWKLFLPGIEGRSFPRCSGTALGLDRLIMILADMNTIDSVWP